MYLVVCIPAYLHKMDRKAESPQKPVDQLASLTYNMNKRPCLNKVEDKH